MQRYDRALLEQSAAAAGNQPGDLTGHRRKADIAPAEPSLAVEIPQALRLRIPPLLKKVVLDDSEQVRCGGGWGWAETGATRLINWAGLGWLCIPLSPSVYLLAPTVSRRQPAWV